MNMMNLFKTIIIVQLFYAFAITCLAYAMPANSLTYVDAFGDLAQEIDVEGVSGDIESSIDSQLNIPVVELGSLIFYSGNILLDLLLNFFFAIPEMIGLLLHGFTMLFNIDAVLYQAVEAFSAAIVTILYVIGLIEILISIRSGRALI